MRLVKCPFNEIMYGEKAEIEDGGCTMSCACKQKKCKYWHDMGPGLEVKAMSFTDLIKQLTEEDDNE